MVLPLGREGVLVDPVSLVEHVVEVFLGVVNVEVGADVGQVRGAFVLGKAGVGLGVLMDDGSAGLEGVLRLVDRGKLLIDDFDEVKGVLGDVGVVRSQPQRPARPRSGPCPWRG